MNATEFTAKWGPQYQAMTKSQMGMDFLEAIESMRMQPTCDPVPHQVFYRMGGIAGYEDCIQKIRKLGIYVRKMEEPTQNYGHNEPEPKADSNNQ